MDIATLVGIIGAFGVIVGAIILGGSGGIFLNIPSIAVVIGGTFMATLAMVTLSQFLGSFKVGLKAILGKDENPEDIIEEAVELANIARKEGILALENQDISNEFLSRGIQMCVDGHPPNLVQNMLTRDMNLALQRHETGIKMFTSMGDVAPAMGMIGTLIGLVQMLSNMDDPKAIGPAMAVALLTTLYGAVIANAFALPIAQKLALRAETERTNKAIILEAISGIQEGMNPKVLQQLLVTFLPESKRELATEE